MRDSMTSTEQMLEFSTFELELSHGIEIKREFFDWVAAYRRWAEQRNLEPLAEVAFLAAFAKAPGVERTRARKKDTVSGRVLKNAAARPSEAIFIHSER